MNVGFELKPCPFCGGKVIIEDISTEDEEYYMIQCTKEECSASACFADYSTTKKGAAEAWNRRAGVIVVNNFGNGEQIKNEGHMTINIGGKNEGSKG